ncbi:MAG: AAA family ATPase [Candidatus Paceibacterota bacterium]|jgi:chromosome segregation protein
MHLKSLELSGFKSFAKKSTLQFTSSITGIVGPNGSGKSNIAEAFRFVLGEQSIKSLRGKRGEDMIWNGALGSSRANRASVKVVFDNSKRLFPSIDFDEVAMERAVNRDNSNEYLLNGSQVRLKDIVELLSSAHIGATGHHIISQGEADRVLTASIRERREMIEDALGLKIYQWKKLESIRKLEKTEEYMKQVESLRREIAPHIKFLKKQVEKVEKAEELRRELIDIFKEYFAIEEARINAEKEAIANELTGPSRELSVLDRELENAKKILTESKHKDDESREVLAIEGKLNEVRAEKDRLMREVGRLEGEITADRRAIEKEESRQKIEELRTVYVKDVEQVLHDIEILGYIDDAKKLFKEVMSTLKAFIARHHTEHDSGSLREVKGEIEKSLVEKNKLEIILQSLLDNEVVLINEYNKLKNSIEEEKDTNREAEKNVFRIIAKQTELRNIVSVLYAKKEVNDRDLETFKHDLGEAGVIVGREAVEYQKLGSNIAVNDHDVKMKQEERRKKIERSKIRLEDSGGLGGTEIMKEFKETEERDAFLSKELQDLEKAKAELRTLITELDLRIDVEFKNGILKINEQFQDFFTMMFGGGKAELTIVKETIRKKKSDIDDLTLALGKNEEESTGDESTGSNIGYDGTTNDNQISEQGPEGIDVNISLPKKKVKGLMMLSGGERALTSIALLFAISQVNPPPFIILDETDAALDEANSKKYGDMIESLSKHSQLILITHNRETMSRSGIIYGVTMGSDGCSRLLSLAFDEAVEVAK